MSATDSESDAEFMATIKGRRTKAKFEWTPALEVTLEEILLKHLFDFKAATREFAKVINKEDPNVFYEVDVKAVRLRWTDIEIRKYRLEEQENIDLNIVEEQKYE